MKKMDKGEMAFHLAVPAVVFLVIMYAGYYVITLVQLLARK
jgi:hypothetical protein